MAGSGRHPRWKARAPAGPTARRASGWRPQPRTPTAEEEEKEEEAGRGRARVGLRLGAPPKGSVGPDLEPRHRAQGSPASRTVPQLQPRPCLRFWRHRRGRESLSRGARARQGGGGRGQSPARGAPGPAHAPQRRPAQMLEDARARPAPPPCFLLSPAPPLYSVGQARRA